MRSETELRRFLRMLLSYRPETCWTGSTSLAIPRLFLVSPDKLDFKNPLTRYSLNDGYDPQAAAIAHINQK